MSALLLQLAGDATVRGTTTHDGMQLLSVYDFVNLACHRLDVGIRPSDDLRSLHRLLMILDNQVATEFHQIVEEPGRNPARYQHTFAPPSIYQSIKMTVLSVLNLNQLAIVNSRSSK